MITRVFAKSTLAGAAVLTLIYGMSAPRCYAVSATIYSGNNAQFGSDASNGGSLQGFTQLRDRWTTDGVPTTITDVFAVPQDCCLFLATAPTTDFSNAQISALQAFVNGGGTFIVSHNGSVAPAMNQILTALGSTMQMTGPNGSGQQIATVVDGSHPFVAGMPIGTNMYAYAPGPVSGGTPLIDSPLGTHIVSVQSIGLGRVLAVGDFDMLNNVVGSFFPQDAISANNVKLWDNLAASCAVPEPTSVALAGLGMLGLIFGRRARR